MRKIGFVFCFSFLVTLSCNTVLAMQISTVEKFIEAGISKKPFKMFSASAKYFLSTKKKEDTVTDTFVSPIRDATFKRLLHNEPIRNSFLKVFLDIPVKKSTLIDSNLKDDSLSIVRNIIQDKKLEDVKREFCFFERKDKEFIKTFKSNCPCSHDFLQEIAQNTEHLKTYFEVRPRRAYADIVCETNNKYVIVEAQNYKTDFLSERFLAYAARLYGMQLKERDAWQNLRAVYGLVFLGDAISPWVDTNQFIRHYMFLDRIEKYKTIDKIQMVEVNLNNYNDNNEQLLERQHAKPEEVMEWMDFFKNAHKYDESVFKTFKCEEIKEAFKEISWKQLTPQEKNEIDEEKAKLLGITEWMQEEKQKGEINKATTIAKNLLQAGIDKKIIIESTGLSLEQLIELETKR